jgi:hypothetical protein
MRVLTRARAACRYPGNGMHDQSTLTNRCSAFIFELAKAKASRAVKEALLSCCLGLLYGPEPSNELGCDAV